MTEPGSTAVLLIVFGALMAASVFFSRALNRLGVPVVLLFLALGILGGSEGLGGIEFNNYELAFRLGTIALVLILFDGGLNTAHSSLRRSILPAGILATVGVLGTAALLAVIARLLGLDWKYAILLGAIVSSTDAAAVFAVLRGGNIRVKERVRSTLEVESCVNDPMAVILTVAAVQFASTQTPIGLQLLVEIPVQLIIGAIVGLAVGYGTRWLLNVMTISTGGLFPVATLASAFLAYGLATLAYGSGFLSVFVAAAVLGNGPLPYKAGLTRVHDAIAWFSQVSMFLMLGLLVYPSQLIPVSGTGLLLGLALAFLARPIVVTLCLLPFRWPWREVSFTSWVGIRGAVPIVLATFPVMAGIPGSEQLFHLVFFVVVISALITGVSLVPLTKRMKLAEPNAPISPVALEMNSLRRMHGEVRVYHIDPSLAVCGVRLSQIRFPEESAAILIVRGDHLLAARGNTTLEAGDHVYVFCRPEDRPFIELLFGQTISQ
ncbi:MAG: potassium/proton antiporter [Phycisphaeraceae bacterium]|nr:MAG: potassium/proton antiporter [Phycisphaeraceae bacterium]